MDYFPFHIWDVILPIDELHHFSAWLKPPTSHESHHRKSGKITKKYKQTKKTPENPEKIQKNPKKKHENPMKNSMIQVIVVLSPGRGEKAGLLKPQLFRKTMGKYVV